ncbi:MAG: hypothetical protein ACYC6N_14045 [Pirellulaceae bacterium]
MQRQISRRWRRVCEPLLLGALLGVAGYLFPQSLGWAQTRQSLAGRQVADERSDAASSDAEAERSRRMFVAGGPAKSSWFSFPGSQRATTEHPPVPDQASGGQAARLRPNDRSFLPPEPRPSVETAPRVATAARNATAESPKKKSLMQSLRVPPSWLSFGRRKPKRADADLPLVDTYPPSRESPANAYPNVVPPKYRTMGAGAPEAVVVRDTAGSPSLVRPSRRPPPDPAPTPPEEERPLVQAPVKEGRLFTRIATASRSWRVTASRPALPAAEPATARQLITEPQLRFTAPDLAGRESKTHAKSTDLVKNMLRPAQSASGTAGNQPPTDPAATVARQTPGTHWMAKRTPTPSASAGSTPADVAHRQAEPAATEGSVFAVPSPVVGNSFDNAAGPPTAATRVPSGARTPTPSRSSLIANPFSAPRSQRSVTWPTPGTERIGGPSTPTGVPRRADASKKPFETVVAQRAAVEPNPAVPAVTLPDRSGVVARTEVVNLAAPVREARTRVAKTPSQARATAPTHAAVVAPSETVSEETLAPLVDAETYRATLADSSARPVPVRTAERPPTPAPPGSWINTYQQLLQSNPSSAAPRPPAGSPQRKLSSQDEPDLPEFPAPILRR